MDVGEGSKLDQELRIGPLLASVQEEAFPVEQCTMQQLGLVKVSITDGICSITSKSEKLAPFQL